MAAYCGVPVKYRNLVVAVLALVAAALNSPQASASVVSTFSVTPDIFGPGGGTGLADLQITLSADPGYFNSSFVSGLATINDGQGNPAATFSIGPGGTFLDYSVNFDYLTGGGFLAGFTITNLQYVEYLDPANSVATSVFADDQSGSHLVLVAVTGPSSTPLPAALPMFAGGLAALGLLALRRKRSPA